MEKKMRVLSGIRPTGRLHIGNYLGALKHFVELQHEYSCFFMIADLHSLNEEYDASIKHRQILEQAADFLAAGLDPKICTLFVQSHMHEHSELAVMLSNVVAVPYLFRMTQYKEKAQGNTSINSGLLFYPVLMASDILLYKPRYIPVGDDQAQHVELARDIAGFFNKKFGETFPEPKALHTETPRVMSLVSPEKKMSKSSGDSHCIYLDETSDAIYEKLKRVPTDSGDASSQGAQNLLGLIKIFMGKDAYSSYKEQAKVGALRYAEIKKDLSHAIADYFKEFRRKKTALMHNPKKLENMLTAGAKKARIVARETLREAKQKMGLEN